MADTARASATSLRRDEILEAVAFAAERFLRAPQWRDVAPEVLARLGSAAAVSRAYVVENVPGPDGRLLARWVAEWTEPGVLPLLRDPQVAEAPWYTHFARWARSLSRGQALLGSVLDFPTDESEILSAHGVASLVSLPVFVGETWWGSIGFDDCRGNREWIGPAFDGLRTAASILSAAIERQRNDEQQREAEHRYRSFVERIPAVTYTDIAENDVVRMGFVSPQIEGILGYPAQDFVDDPTLWTRLMHPDDLARMRADGTLNTDDVTPFDQEYRMSRADGRTIWVHDTSAPVFGPDGSVDYFQGFMVDVTRSKEAEQRLRRAEERFRVLVEQMPAVIYTKRTEHGSTRATALDYVSPQAAAIIGYPTTRWLKDLEFWESLVHPEDRERATAVMEHANATGEPLSVDYRMVAADGRTVWVHEEAVLVRDSEGGPAHWQGLMLDVTERRHAETQVRVAEERFRTIVEHTPAITYQESLSEPYDHMSSMTYVSPQIESILGYAADEWTVPGFWAQVIHPADLQAVLGTGGQSIAAGQSYRQDYRVFAHDGRVVWFHDESHLISDAEGTPLLWQGVMVDITERKEAEEQLRRAQERLQALIDHIPAVVYIEAPDADPAKFYVGPQVQDILGYTAEEWTWTPDFWIDHVHPDDLSMVEQADRASNGHGVFAMDYRFRRSDGAYVWLHDQAVFVPTEDGEGFWQGFLFDITERKEAEEQLLETERLFRATVEHLPAIVYREPPEPDPERFYISPQIERVLGYTPEEWTATLSSWNERVHPSDRDAVRTANDAANATRQPFSAEYRLRRKDGAHVWIHDEASFVDEPGRERFWQGFMLDVTERKQAQEQLERALDVEREATKRLRTLDEMKNTFLQAVSHDLRTPLAAILGLAITLERGGMGLSEDDARDLAGRIAGNARRLDRLVTNLLDLDRLARGIVAPKLQPTDVGSLVRRVVAESELIADSRLRTEAQPVIVPVDAAKVERIVENLLANMARHAPEHATIWVSVRPVDEGVLVLVEDDGSGVAPELRETIFEPFRQGPEAPRHSPGVGVGLTLVRRFAELHGGRAWVEDREGGGASFRVFLPAVPGPASEASAR